MAAQRSVYAATKYLWNRFSGNSGVAPEYSFDNAKFLQWRNAADTADINVIGLDSSNVVQFPSGANFTGTVSINGITSGLLSTPASNNNAGNNVIPPTSIVNAVYLRNQAGTARTDTTDTAANIVAAIPGARNGTRFTWIVWNVGNAANALTLAAGTNVTFANVATVANNTTKEFTGVVTNATVAAVTIYPV